MDRKGNVNAIIYDHRDVMPMAYFLSACSNMGG